MKNNRISYYYINNNNMTNNTKRTKKPCKRGKKSRTTLKRSFKKRGGSVKKQRSRAKTPAAPSSVKKRNQRNHIYEKVTNYSPTPYARLHGKKKTLKKNKGSPVYDNLQRVKGPVQPGTDTLLDNEIAEGKRGMKLKGGFNDEYYAHLSGFNPKPSSEHNYANLNRGPKVKELVEKYEQMNNPKKSKSRPKPRPKPNSYEKIYWNVPDNSEYLDVKPKPISPVYQIPVKRNSKYQSQQKKKEGVVYDLGNNNWPTIGSDGYVVPSQGPSTPYVKPPKTHVYDLGNNNSSKK
jgi:hypothetical protein